MVHVDKDIQLDSIAKIAIYLNFFWIAGCARGEYLKSKNVCAKCPKGQYMTVRNEHDRCFLCSPNQDTYREGSKSYSDCYGKQIRL